MIRRGLAALALTLLLFNILPAQSEADDAYIKAMTANNPAQKAQLLKDYVAKFAGKGSKYENFFILLLPLLLHYAQGSGKPEADAWDVCYDR